MTFRNPAGEPEVEVVDTDQLDPFQPLVDAGGLLAPGAPAPPPDLWRPPRTLRPHTRDMWSRKNRQSAPRAARERGALAQAGSDSGVESLVRQRLERRGHRVEQQVHVRGVGRVDMRIDGELYLEIDGYAFHSDAGSFERDRLRDSTLAELGHRRLRVSARQVVGDWRRVEAAIDRIVQRA